jgi:predicted nucleic acid-binding protein
VERGSRVFIDASIFIYHFTGTSPGCRRFLESCERGQVEGITSVTALAEVAHRLMMIEAVAKGLISPGNPARKLREKPAIVKELHVYLEQVELIPLMGIAVLSLDLETLGVAAALRRAVLAVGAGLAWAMTLIALRHLDRPRHRDTSGDGATSPDEAGLAAVVAGNVLACAIAVPWAIPLPAAAAADWSTVTYLGAIQIALAYVCLTNATRRLPALDVSLLLLLEPVLNPLWTWIVHGEHPGGWAIAGGAVILTATVARTLVMSSDLPTPGSSQ